ncbi:MAG: hypothetical protein FWG09_00350 [Synergistaceae bacterium]|nr:hypothetical protein [Synergistaceae bacterium]
MKEGMSSGNAKYETESAVILKNVTHEAKRRPDLLAALIMTWIDEDSQEHKKHK